MKGEGGARTDIYCGAAVALAGGLISAYTLQNYTLGSFSDMGSGMVPLLLGIALFILGCATALGPVLQLAATELAGEGLSLKEIRRPLVFVVLAILSFAVLVNILGVVPSVILMTCIGRAAAGRQNLYVSIILGAVLAALAAAIFVFGLSTPIPLFWW